MYFKKGNIQLTALDKTHIKLVMDWINNESINETNGPRFPVSETEQGQWVEQTIKANNKKKMIVWADERPVGMVSLHQIHLTHRTAEIGVYIDPLDQRNGYAAQAVGMILDFAFQELNLRKIYAYVQQDNNASIQLFTKIGFGLEAVLKEAIYTKGKYIDNHIFTIFKPS